MMLIIELCALLEERQRRAPNIGAGGEACIALLELGSFRVGQVSRGQCPGTNVPHSSLADTALTSTCILDRQV